MARAEALGHNRANTELHRPARRWLPATLITAETPAWDRVMYSSRWRGAHCLCSGGLLEGGKKKAVFRRPPQYTALLPEKMFFFNKT